MVARLIKRDTIQLLKNQMRLLVPLFADVERAMGSAPADRGLVAELRARTAHAGDVLLQLVHHGVVEPPSPLPPWLSLSLRSGRRPRFERIFDHDAIGLCRPPLGRMGISKVIGQLIETFEPGKTGEQHRRWEVDPTPFRRRHAFLEAVTGWLGVQLGLVERLRLPSATVITDQSLGEPEATMNLCLDLLQGKECKAPQFYLDLARACRSACAALVEQLEPVSRAQAEPEHTMSATPPHLLYEIAVATLREAESIVDFHRNCRLHHEWAALRHQIPSHLISAEDEYHSARADESLAAHELSEALNGQFYNGWIDQMHRDPAGTLLSLQTRAERASGRLAKATANFEATHDERRREEHVIAASWLDDHNATFAKRRRALEVEFGRHAHSIETLRPDPFVLHEWKGTCACTVLLEIAATLVAIADIDSTGRDWMEAHALREKLALVSHSDWRNLEIAVRKEAASVAHLSNGRHELGGPNNAGAISNAIHAIPSTNAAPLDTSSPGFFRDGDGWTVEFAGRRTVVADMVGMLYLQRLLSNPHIPQSATSLVGQDGPAESQQAVTSSEALKDVRKRLKEIEADLVDRSSPLTCHAEDALHREKGELLDALKTSSTLHGIRAMGTNASKAVGVVRGAIRRALLAIKGQHEGLWSHLDQSLVDRDGSNPCYRPSFPITWRVNA